MVKKLGIISDELNRRRAIVGILRDLYPRLEILDAHEYEHFVKLYGHLTQCDMVWFATTSNPRLDGDLDLILKTGVKPYLLLQFERRDLNGERGLEPSGLEKIDLKKVGQDRYVEPSKEGFKKVLG